MAPNVKKVDPNNLVYLVYSANTCYTSVVAEAPEGVKVDLEGGTWRFEDEGPIGAYKKNCVYEIGSGRRHCEWGSQWGIIGVL